MPRRLTFALLTVSDTRTLDTDSGGDAVVEHARKQGHNFARRAIVRDDAAAIRAWVQEALAEPAIDVVVVTGGTGVAKRDVTPEAVLPLFEKSIPGFGEAFRRLSFDAIGPAGTLSRAEAGVARGKAVFLLPGSPAGVALAMESLVLPLSGHIRELTGA